MVKSAEQRTQEQARKAAAMQRRAGRPPSLSRRMWAKYKKFQRAAMSGSDRLPKEDHWGRVRIFLANFIFSHVFEAFMGLVILFNIFLIIIETDRRINCVDQESPECPANNQDIVLPDQVCLGLYCVELAMRIFVYQRKFLLTRWNVFDLCIVVLSILGEVFGGVIGDAVIIRVIRITRLVRMLRLLTAFQELYLMMAGMATTIRTIFWATITLMAVLSVQSLVAVELLRPVAKVLQEQGAFKECPRCNRAFDSVVASMITFFQTLLMGEGVNELLVPLIEEDWLAGVFLFISTIFVYLGLSNLILSVIVEKANEARKSDSFYTQLVNKKLKHDAKKVLIDYWKTADVDFTNTLTLAELRKTYEEQEFFRNYFISQDMELPFLEYAFRLGLNGRGGEKKSEEEETAEIQFEDFAEAVVHMKNSDMGTVMSLIKCQVATIIEEIGTLQHQVLELTSDLTDHMAINARAYNAEYEAVGYTSEGQHGGGLFNGNGGGFSDWWTRLSGYQRVSLTEPGQLYSAASGQSIPDIDQGHHPYSSEEFEEPKMPNHQSEEAKEDDYPAADEWSDDPYGGPQPQEDPFASPREENMGAELADMLKSAYGNSLPLDLPNLDEVQRNFAKLCERVEAQLDRLDGHWLDDNEFSQRESKKEVYAAGARLLGRLGKSMTKMLNDSGEKPSRPKLRRQSAQAHKFFGDGHKATLAAAPKAPIMRQATRALREKQGDEPTASMQSAEFAKSRTASRETTQFKSEATQFKSEATEATDNGHKEMRGTRSSGMEDFEREGRRSRPRSSHDHGDGGSKRHRRDKSRRSDVKEF